MLAPSTIVVLHAAMGLLEQAKPHTLYTHIANYTSPKALQFKRFVFVILGSLDISTFNLILTADSHFS
jgi:hypothetical protein